tara:strand:+ start:981 stop:1679 length:699 start_codon:yes stop_codon:yes gene_type:complete
MAVAKKTKKILTVAEEIQLRFEKTTNLFLNSKLKPCMDACAVSLEDTPEDIGYLNLLASAHWRKGNLKEHLSYATKAYELEPENITANMLLGLACSLKGGREQDALKMFSFCLSKEPENCDFLRYRALAYVSLEELNGLPPKIKEKYMMKADEDLQSIMRVVGETEVETDFRKSYYRSFAQLYLLKYMNAKNEAEKAIELFDEEPDPSKKDRNLLKEIKVHLRKSVGEMKKQ